MTLGYQLFAFFLEFLSSILIHLKKNLNLLDLSVILAIISQNLGSDPMIVSMGSSRCLHDVSKTHTSSHAHTYDPFIGIRNDRYYNWNWL